MQLRVSNMANAINILVKAEAKWEQYNKDLYDSDGDQKLLFESGEEVKKLPGTSTDSVLWKYKTNWVRIIKELYSIFVKQTTTIYQRD